MQGFMEEGDGSTLMLLGNLDMDSLHNLVLGLCKGGGGGGSCSGRRDGLGGFGAIPDVLELEAKSNGRAAWVESMQNGLQKFSEATKVHVFM